MLELRGYTEGLTQLREKTMAELVDRFRRSLDELVQEGRRQGIQQGARQGRDEGQVLLLRRQIARKFGDNTAGQLSELLDDLTGIDNIDRVTRRAIGMRNGRGVHRADADGLKSAARRPSKAITWPGIQPRVSNRHMAATSRSCPFQACYSSARQPAHASA